MLMNSNKVRAFNRRLKDIMTATPQIYPRDIESFIAQKIGEGWKLKFAPNSGTIDTTTWGGGNWIVVLPTTTTGAYTINADTEAGVDNIIIIGAAYTSAFILFTKVPELTLTVLARTYTKTTIKYCIFNSVIDNGTVGIIIENCIIKSLAYSSNFYDNFSVRNSFFTILGFNKGILFRFNTTTNVFFENNVFITNGGIVQLAINPTFGGVFYVKNCDFKNIHSSKPYFRILTFPNGFMEFINCYFENFIIRPGTGGIVGNGIDYVFLFGHKISIEERDLMNYSIFQIIPKSTFANLDDVNYEGFNEIDMDELLDTDNYKDLEAVITLTHRTVKGIGGKYTHKFYNLIFQEKKGIDRDFKYFADDDHIFIERTDFDDYLKDKFIKDGVLYSSLSPDVVDDGFRADENFLIIAENATAYNPGLKAIFAYYQGGFTQTIFGQIFPLQGYKILKCYQHLRPPLDLEIRNANIGTWQEDAPLEGAIMYQDMTAVFRIGG